MSSPREEVASAIRDIPIEQLSPARDAMFAADTIYPVFDRLRAEDPVHFVDDPVYGPFWSITRHDDIVAVESNYEAFSSAKGTALLSIESQANATNLAHRHFMEMDPPEHGLQRRTILPVVAPSNLVRLKPLIRERAAQILDSLPIGEEFDWVDLVSKELTSMMLATLLDFPQEDRRKLTFWSDVLTNAPGFGPVTSWEQKRTEIQKFHAAILELRELRRQSPPSFDLVSMLVHGEHTKDVDVDQYIMNMSLLLIGGNDTTRNTISGSLNALNLFPEEFRKLRANPALIPSMVAESIRWQTPIAHMIRTATRDTELRGKLIRAGERVVLWYVSANRDDLVIPDPYSYVIDRENPRPYLAFGYGIHRCLGNGLATLQLTIIWEEILKRFPEIRVTGTPRRTHSVRFRGFESLPVTIPARI
ncbi:cytochrome P450 [Novosphingobium bradum]|uniref:Cytochrome P450 n=1 Tax=Novosphingobium bradum TaxID=1737444 RepID=A0ABV7INI6_9SPHN